MLVVFIDILEHVFSEREVRVVYFFDSSSTHCNILSLRFCPHIDLLCLQIAGYAVSTSEHKE